MRYRVIVDERERSSGIPEELKKFDVFVKFDTLIVGDYLISSDVVVERKSASDFINSIIDGRLFDQAGRLKDSYERPIIIVEGELGRAMKYVQLRSENAIWGALASMVLDFKIPVITTESYLESAKLIAALVRREHAEKKPTKRFVVKGKHKLETMEEKQQAVLQSLPGIGPTLAERLIRHFKTLRAIFNASPSQLRIVSGMNELKAKELYELFNYESKKGGEFKQLKLQ